MKTEPTERSQKAQRLRSVARGYQSLNKANAKVLQAAADALDKTEKDQPRPAKPSLGKR
jgi:hypothetical protein